MSTVRNPREKKRLSLERDRRNTYGENDKSSRKNIPRAKQRRHMDERRTVAQALSNLKGTVYEDDALQVEVLTRTRTIDSRRRGFKKCPDTPLKDFLARKRPRSR
jgi:hypothetical protein